MRTKKDVLIDAISSFNEDKIEALYHFVSLMEGNVPKKKLAEIALPSGSWDSLPISAVKTAGPYDQTFFWVWHYAKDGDYFGNKFNLAEWYLHNIHQKWRGQ